MSRISLKDRVLIGLSTLSLLIILVLVSVSNSIVYAISDPDSISIESIQVFRNYAESDDQLWIIEYNIAYASTPDEDPREAFFAGIGDGSSILKPTFIRSYGHSLVSIYLDADNALTWEGTYFIHVSGVAGIFTTLSIGVNQQLLAVDASDWDDSTTSEASRIAAGQHILDVVESIEIDTGEDLLTDLRKLSTAGSALIRANIFNAIAYLSSIFTVVIEPLIEPSPTFSQDYQGTLEARRGPRLEGALEDLGVTVLGKTGQGQVIGTIGFLLISITILGSIYSTTRDSTSSLVISLPLIYVGNQMGILSLSLMFVSFLFVAILFGVTFILSRG